MRLLDDDTPLTYAGSREAMLGNSFHYRVKDAAGYYLGKLTGHPLEFHETARGPRHRTRPAARGRCPAARQPAPFNGYSQ